MKKKAGFPTRDFYRLERIFLRPLQNFFGDEVGQRGGTQFIFSSLLEKPASFPTESRPFTVFSYLTAWGHCVSLIGRGAWLLARFRGFFPAGASTRSTESAFGATGTAAGGGARGDLFSTCLGPGEKPGFLARSWFWAGLRPYRRDHSDCSLHKLPRANIFFCQGPKKPDYCQFREYYMRETAIIWGMRQTLNRKNPATPGAFAYVSQTRALSTYKSPSAAMSERHACEKDVSLLSLSVSEGGMTKVFQRV